MGNAERQARWRERQKAKLDAALKAAGQGDPGEVARLKQDNAKLRHELEALRNAQPAKSAQPNATKLEARIAELEQQLALAAKEARKAKTPAPAPGETIETLAEKLQQRERQSEGLTDPHP